MGSLFLGLTCGRYGSSHQSTIDVRMHGKKSKSNSKKRVRERTPGSHGTHDALMAVFVCRTMGLVVLR